MVLKELITGNAQEGFVFVLCLSNGSLEHRKLFAGESQHYQPSLEDGIPH